MGVRSPLQQRWFGRHDSISFFTLNHFLAICNGVLYVQRSSWRMRRTRFPGLEWQEVDEAAAPALHRSMISIHVGVMACSPTM